MNRIILASTALLTAISGSAMAADLSRPPPAPAPVYTKAPMMPAFTWTGCYVGGNGGGLFAAKNWTDTFTGLPESSVNINSWLVGGQVGCNYQMGTFVIGIQGDYDWTNANGSATDALAVPVGFATDNTNIKSLASVTGRAGWAWDRFLGYVKGGGAWVKDSYSGTSTTGLLDTASETRTGWTAGVGGEYAFTNWLTGFVEYDYYYFGTKTNAFTGTLGLGSIDIKQTMSVAKGGFNIKFGGWN
jgi:outer membrane immunogenic protein